MFFEHLHTYKIYFELIKNLFIFLQGDGSLNIDAGGASRSRRGSFAPGNNELFG